MRMRTLGWLGLAAAAVLLAGPMLWHLGHAAQLAAQSTAFTQAPSSVAQRLLIVGDSTAVGTGASAPEHSLAGLIGRGHPHLLIDNRGRDGATFDNVLQQLAQGGRYDIVLVLAGGNDVTRLRDLDQVAQDIDKVLQAAAAQATQVVVMPAGNVGNAPVFLPPVSWLMSWRSRVLHAHVRAAAQRHGALYVDLYEQRADDPFVQREGMHARDGIHPSDQGYALWLQALREQADLQRRLAASALPHS